MKINFILLIFLLAISLSGNAKGCDSLTFILNEFKYNVLKIQNDGLAKVYGGLQRSQIDPTTAKQHLLSNHKLVQKILLSNYLNNKFDSLTLTGNGISVEEVFTIKNDKNIEAYEGLVFDIESIIQSTEYIFENLQSFEDYENSVTKFLAEDELESEIIPKSYQIIKLIEEANQSIIKRQIKKRRNKIKVRYDNSDIETLITVNESLVRETESISLDFSKPASDKEEGRFINDYDEFQLNLSNHLRTIDQFLFYKNHLANKKRISKAEFALLFKENSNTSFVYLKRKIQNNIDSFADVVLPFRKTVLDEKEQNEEVNNSDPLIAFHRFNLEQNQEHYFREVKQSLEMVSTILELYR